MIDSIVREILIAKDKPMIYQDLKMDEVAIFWDYENIKVVASGINLPLAESLLEYSKSVGHTRIKKFILIGLE